MKNKLIRVDLESEIKDLLEERFNEKEQVECADWHHVVDWSQTDEGEYDITVEECGKNCEVENGKL